MRPGRDGAIFRRAKANLTQGIKSDDALRYRAKMENAIELIAIGERQARVNNEHAQAIEMALSSISRIPPACLLVGTILIVKYPDDQGSVVLVRPLSALELRTLERFPGIQRDPCNAIEMLAAAVMTVEPADGTGG
jgi:hypothetical protein